MIYRQSPSKVWRSQKSKYRLIGCKCSHCSHLYYPSVIYCTECGSKSFESYLFKGIGKVLSYSMIYVPPAGFERFIPYPVAIVELTEGIRLSTQLVDWEDVPLKIGIEVEATFRKLFNVSDEDIIHYGIKFRPIRSYKLARFVYNKCRSV